VKKREIDVLACCDVVELDGSPKRLTLSVSCTLEEVGPLPVAGDFILSDGDPIRYFGHDGGAFLDFEIQASSSNVNIQGGLGEYLRLVDALPVPVAVDGRLHRVTRRHVSERMLAGYVRHSDPAGTAPYVDDGAIETTAAAVREAVGRHVVLSEGRAFVRMPLPVWQAWPNRREIELEVHLRPRYTLNGMAEFAAGRLAAAQAYCDAETSQEDSCRPVGRVEFLDPAFVELDDLAVVAGRAGRFVSSQLRHDLVGMPSRMIRRWHEAAQASTTLKGEAWRAVDCLRSVADLMLYADDPGNGCNVREELAFWKAHRRRIFEIEGIEPSHAVVAIAAGPRP
jgi:hypothetical protein